MKKISVFLVLLITVLSAPAQNIDKFINQSEAERVTAFLASDEMKGRALGSPELNKAAAFIAKEFSKAGLKPLKGESDFFQKFNIYRSENLTKKVVIDGKEIPQKNIAAISYRASAGFSENDNPEIVLVKKGDNVYRSIYPYLKAEKNVLIILDSSFQKIFGRLSQINLPVVKPTEGAVVMVLGNYEPKHFQVQLTNKINKTELMNVAGLITGKSKPEEFVIFSAHYDHIGVDNRLEKDTIFNGANDDASGTAAVVLLSKYFKALKNNERSVIFIAFTAEESGGFGSKYFSENMDPEKVVAMLNIEMIGTDSKWGKNSAYITGYDKSDLGKILQENLVGSAFKFFPDPYLEQELFYRSDNATLASYGVPAHTISTSKMDNEPNYHKPSDEINTLDFENMTKIIEAIGKSAESVISGKDTPSRIPKLDQ